MGVFQDLGKALRWLRTRQDRKQYEIADEAGITKAMLSAYETGKQNPSIETLEKILGALNLDLLALHKALQVNQSGDEARSNLDSWSAGLQHPGRGRVFPMTDSRTSLYHILDIDHPLPPDQEFAFSQMLSGYHALLRHMYHEFQRRSATGPPEGGGPQGGGQQGGEPAPEDDDPEDLN